MRFAIVSDLHANAQAWNAVLADIGSSAVDRILCLGDIVGYGPDPADVLGSVYRHVHGLVLGNHDAVVCGKMSPETFTDRAQRMIRWTQARLGRRAREFLETLPLTLTGPDLRCAHGDFVNPAAFNYLLHSEDADANWRVTDEALLFVGHSHHPGLFVRGRSGVPHDLPAQDFEVEPGKRYIVNIGSVGSPRDGDARAGYVLYDASSRTVVFRRVPYDADAFRMAVQRAGCDPDDVPALRVDPRRRLTSVREQLDFAPAETRAQEACDVVAVGDATQRLKRRVSRWQWIAAVLTLLAGAGIGTTWTAVRRLQPQPLALPGEPLPPVPLQLARTADGNLLPPLPDALGPDGGVRPWRLVYGDRRRQRLDLAADTGVRITSATPEVAIRLEAPPVRLDEDDPRRLLILGEIHRSDAFEGDVRLVVDILRAAGGQPAEWQTGYQTVVFRAAPGSDGAEQARRTQTFPKAAQAVRVSLEGRFAGGLDVRSVRLQEPE